MRGDPIRVRGPVQELTRLLGAAGSGPVIVHSDLFNAGFFLPRGVSDRKRVLEQHWELLQAACATTHLWHPTFNYDFPKTRVFRPSRDPAQLGPLPEYFRCRWARWRTHVPIFSFSGPSLDSLEFLAHLMAPRARCEIDPFGDGSVFDSMASRRGRILFYGAHLASCTFLHHVERASGGPAYRYDKRFDGEIVTETAITPVTLNYHVRPMGQHLDYDWDRLESELLEHGILRLVVEGSRVLARIADAKALRAFWLEKLAGDPLHLLDQQSRDWVAPKLSKLGRRFQVSDFEGGTS